MAEVVIANRIKRPPAGEEIIITGNAKPCHVSLLVRSWVAENDRELLKGPISSFRLRSLYGIKLNEFKADISASATGPLISSAKSIPSTEQLCN